MFLSFYSRDSSGGSIPACLGQQTWTGVRLPDDFMLNHRGDVDLAHKLIQRTLTCSKCGKRHAIGGEVDGVEYCKCGGGDDGGGGGGKGKKHGVAWTPFLEKPNILVWRQEHPEVRSFLTCSFIFLTCSFFA